MCPAKAFNLENLLAGSSGSPARPKVKAQAKLISPRNEGKKQSQPSVKAKDEAKQKNNKGSQPSAKAKVEPKKKDAKVEPSKVVDANVEAKSKIVDAETKSQPGAAGSGGGGWVIFFELLWNILSLS